MTLSRPVRRLAALTILIVLPWTIWTGLAAPLLEAIARDRESIAQSQRVIARYGQLADATPELQRRLSALQSAADDRAFLLETTSASLAAEMQAAAQSLTASAGAVLRSSRTLPREVDHGFGKIGVDLELAATTAALTTLLHAIGVAQPAIRIERMAVRIAENGVAPKAADGQPLLGVSLRLISYSRPLPTAVAAR